MYCSRCGAQNPDDGGFCRKCGAPLVPSPATPVDLTVATRQTSGLAVASLVLGILGFMTGFTSVLAIIFGGIALSQMSKDTRLEGKGMAIAGLVLGIVVLVFGLLIAALVAIASMTAFEAGSLTGA
jgi:hypothetical protein